MSRKWTGTLAVLTAVVGIDFSTAEAGWLCFGKSQKCESCCTSPSECCQPKRSCCFHPQEAPRGDIAFAIPGVVRSGQAVQVSDEVVRRGIHEAAAREFRRTDAASGSRGLEEDRLDKLEKDVEKLAELTNRLTVVVEKLDRKVEGLR